MDTDLSKLDDWEFKGLLRSLAGFCRSQNSEMAAAVAEEVSVRLQWLSSAVDAARRAIDGAHRALDGADTPMTPLTEEQIRVIERRD